MFVIVSLFGKKHCNILNEWNTLLKLQSRLDVAE